jgi:hypothetical protein
MRQHVLQMFLEIQRIVLVHRKTQSVLRQYGVEWLTTGNVLKGFGTNDFWPDRGTNPTFVCRE